jgi:hypothetical protein
MNVGGNYKELHQTPFEYQGVMIFTIDTCDFQKIKCPNYDI